MNKPVANKTFKPVSKDFGHVALHFLEKEDGPLTAKFLELIGFTRRATTDRPDGSQFYHFVLGPNSGNDGDNILFVFIASDHQRALAKATREALKIGTPQEHPAVTAYRNAAILDPELGFHVGILLPTFEDVEDAVIRMREALDADPALKKRVHVKLNRPKPGLTPAVDAVIEGSRVFKDTPNFIRGRNGVQAFFETDLIAGPLGQGFVFELDYVFLGHGEHMLSARGSGGEFNKAPKLT